MSQRMHRGFTSSPREKTKYVRQDGWKLPFRWSVEEVETGGTGQKAAVKAIPLFPNTCC